MPLPERKLFAQTRSLPLRYPVKKGGKYFLLHPVGKSAERKKIKIINILRLSNGDIDAEKKRGVESVV
ncbi:MAG: hypothetical protein D3922_04990 [Candidatus Electrothrix sp. AR1]|nr:hypothetical protein [Candidatus Electrothrix sp. AR1]